MINFCRKDTKFYNQKFIHPSKPVKHKDLTGNNVNFALFMVSGSSYNTFTDEGYPASRISSCLNLNESLYIVETQYIPQILSSSSFKTQYPVPPGYEQYFKTRNSNPTQPLTHIFNFRHMYAIDSNQYLKEKQEFHVSHAYIDHTSRDPAHSSSH